MNNRKPQLGEVFSGGDFKVKISNAINKSNIFLAHALEFLEVVQRILTICKSFEYFERKIQPFSQFNYEIAPELRRTINMKLMEEE